MSDKICLLLVEGMPIHKICELDGMPDASTIFRWTWTHPEFYEAFDKAREHGAHAMNYKLLERLDEADPETPGEIAKLKMIVEQHRWFIGKINQRKYGERTILSGDKDNPIAIGIAAALDNRIANAKALPTPDSPLIAPPVIDGEFTENNDND